MLFRLMVPYGLARSTGIHKHLGRIHAKLYKLNVYREVCCINDAS